MPDTYLQDVKKIMDALSRDEGLILEEKLLLLGLVTDYVEAMTEELEGKLVTRKDRLVN